MKELFEDLEVLCLVLLSIDLFFGFYLTFFKPIKDYFLQSLSIYLDRKLDEAKLDKKSDFSMFMNRGFTNFTERVYNFFPFIHKPLIWIFVYLVLYHTKNFF